MEVSQLRIVADLETSAYVSGSQKKASADRTMIASDQQVADSAKRTGAAQTQAAADAAGAAEKRVASSRKAAAAVKDEGDAVVVTAKTLDNYARHGAGAARIDAQLEAAKRKLVMVERDAATAVQNDVNLRGQAARAIDAQRASVARLEQALVRETQAQAATQYRVQGIRPADAGGFKSTVGGFGRVASSATIAAVAVLGFGTAVYRMAGSIASAGDELRTMQARFNVLTGAADGSLKSFDLVFGLAQKMGVSLSDAGDGFAKVAIAANDLGATSDQIARVTQTFLELGRVGGATEQQLASGLQQFGQALSSGVLQGDELRSLRENVPMVVKAIAKEFNVTTGEVKALGEQGKLTADRLLAAMTAASKDADTAFKRIPGTVEQASARASNSWKLFSAELDRSLGISSTLNSAITSIADQTEETARRMRGDIVLVIKDLRTEAAALQAQVDKARQPVGTPVIAGRPGAFGPGRVLSFEEMQASRNQSLATGARASADEVERFMRRLQDEAGAAEFHEAAQRAAAAAKTELDKIYKATLPINQEFVQFTSLLEKAIQLLVKGRVSAQDFYDATSGIGGRIAAAQNAADPTIAAMADAEDAGKVERAGRTQRQITAARLAAEREADKLIEQGRLGTVEREGFIATRIAPTVAAIRTAVSDLFQDLDRQNKMLLGMVDAYGKGLSDAYREAARQAGIAAGDTQAGVSAKAVETQKIIEQSLQGLQILRAGNLDFDRQAESAERLVNAEMRGVAATRDAQRQNDILQFSYDAVARAKANLDAATESGDARRIASAKAVVDKVNEEIARRDELIKRVQETQRQQTATALNRQFDPVEQLKAQLDQLRDVEKLLTPAARQNALEEFYIRAARAGNSWLDGARAGLLEFARTSRNVGDAVASALVGAFQQGTDALARLMLGMKVDFRSLVADLKLSLARAFIGATITGPIAGMFGGLLGGVGGQAVASGGAGGGGLLGLLGGGGGLGGGGLFGSGPGGIGGFFNSPLFGPGGLLSSEFGPALPGATGTLGGGLGGLLGIGMGIMGLAQGNTIGGLSGILGGGLGLAAMLPGMGFLGPIGMGIGLLGSILGGLTKKKPKSPQGVSNLAWTDGSWITSVAMNRGKGNLSDGTSKAGGAVGDIIDELTGMYGLGLGPGTPGGFLINSIGKKTGNLWQVGLGTYANPQQLPTGFQNGGSTVTAAYSDPQQAISALAAMIVKAGAAGGSLTGLTATQQTALRSEKVLDIESIKRALDFSKIYDKLARGRENITAAEDAIESINDEFRSLKVQAQNYGLDVGIINQRMEEARRKLATDFNDATRRNLLGINDPDALAREDLTKAQEAREKEARYLETLFPGLINFADLIALSNAELVELEKTLGHANDNIRDALDRIKFGPDISNLTLKQRYGEALGQYQGLEAQALRGDPSLDKDKLTQVGDLFLQLSRQLYSINSQNAGDISRVQRLYEWMLGTGTKPSNEGQLVNDFPGMASGGFAGPGVLDVGEYGRERIRLHSPATIYSRGDVENVSGSGRETVRLLRSVVDRLERLERQGGAHIGIAVEGVKEQRAHHATARETRDEVARDRGDRRAAGQMRGAA